jgi:hypothetical protein
MTITIKKVRNYVLLGTVISASATAPAQASLLKNSNSNNDLTITSDNKASIDNKDLVEKQNCKEADSCISSPELDLYHQFNKNDNKNSIDNSLLEKDRDTIKSDIGASLSQIITIEDGVERTVNKTEFTPLESPEQYTSTYMSLASEKKRVPEPSALLGLIAFFLLAAKKGKTAKNSQTLVE